MKLINFYEVMDRKGDIAWGGENLIRMVNALNELNLINKHAHTDSNTNSY